MSHDIHMQTQIAKTLRMLPTKNHNLRNIIYILGQINNKLIRTLQNI